MKIESGIGNGKDAGVTGDNRLMVESSVRSAQSRVSIEDGDTYQVITSPIDVTDTDDAILLIKNNSATKNIVITYIRIETIGVAAASVDAYSTVGIVRGSYIGGASIIPVNLNTLSGKVASDIVIVDGASAITITGFDQEIDRSYKANDLTVYEKEGSIVIGTGGAIRVKHKGSTVAGIVIARISFYLTEKGNI